MKRNFLIASIVAGALSIAFLAMAGERMMATSQTNSAIDVIASGMDWDGATPISLEQQLDRMESNVKVLVSQKSARNKWGGLGAVTTLIAIGSVMMMRKQDDHVTAAPNRTGE